MEDTEEGALKKKRVHWRVHWRVQRRVQKRVHNTNTTRDT
jgi:hypothetical protein